MTSRRFFTDSITAPTMVFNPVIDWMFNWILRINGVVVRVRVGQCGGCFRLKYHIPFLSVLKNISNFCNKAYFSVKIVKSSHRSSLGIQLKLNNYKTKPVLSPMTLSSFNKFYHFWIYKFFYLIVLLPTSKVTVNMWWWEWIKGIKLRLISEFSDFNQEFGAKSRAWQQWPWNLTA